MSSVTDVVTGTGIRLACEVGAFLFSNHEITSLRGRRKKGSGRGEGEREKGRERLL